MCVVAIVALLPFVSNAADYTITYHVIDNNKQVAVSVPVWNTAPGQSGTSAPSLPSGFRSPLVESYTYYSDAACTTQITALPGAPASGTNVDVYVKYTVKTDHAIKLNGTKWYNFKANEVYYSYDGTKFKAIKTNDLSTEPARCWKMEGEDPYNVRIINGTDNEKWITYVGDATTISLSNSSDSRLMVVCGGGQGNISNDYYHLVRRLNASTSLSLTNVDVYSLGSANTDNPGLDKRNYQQGTGNIDASNGMAVRFAAIPNVYTYKILNANKEVEVSVPFDGSSTNGQAAGSSPSLPPAFVSPLVSKYKYYSDAACEHELTALPDANADIYVTYTVNTKHSVKLDGSTYYNYKVNNAYYAVENGNITKKGNTLSSADNRLWCLTGDPYDVRIVNKSDPSKWITYEGTATGATLSSSTDSRLMLVAGDNNTSNTYFALVRRINDSGASIVAVDNGSLNTNVTYNRSGDGKASFTGGMKIYFDAPPITYTYHVIDKANREAIAIPIDGNSTNGQLSGATPVLPLGFRSPLVSEYKYYSDPSCTQELTALPNVSADIYVTYTVNANHTVKLDGKSEYNFLVNSNYYKLENNSFNTAGNTLSSDENRLFTIAGNDPYDVRIYNNTNTSQWIYYAGESGTMALGTKTDHRLMLISWNNDLTSEYMQLAYGMNAGGTGVYLVDGSGANPGLVSHVYNREGNGGVVQSNGTRVKFVAPPRNYTYKVIDNQGGVALTYAASNATTLGLPAYLQSPYAKNFTYYTEATDNGNGTYTIPTSATAITELPNVPGATIYVRYEWDEKATFTQTQIDGTDAAIALDLNGGTYYSLRVNNLNVYANDNGRVTKKSNNAFDQIDRQNQWRLTGQDPYNVTITNRNVDGKVVTLTSTDAALSPAYLSMQTDGAEGLTISRFMILRNTNNAVSLVAHGIETPNVKFVNGGYENISIESRTDFTGIFQSNGVRVRFTPVPANRRYDFHVMHFNAATDGTREELVYAHANRKIGDPITLPDEWKRPFCNYDGKFYRDPQLTQEVTNYWGDASGSEDIHIYYTFSITEDGHKVFTTWDDLGVTADQMLAHDYRDAKTANIHWHYLTMPRQNDKTYFVKYVSGTGGDNDGRVMAEDTHRIPDHGHQWGLIGNPYECYLVNRQVNDNEGVLHFAAMSDNPVGSTEKYIDFKAGHTNNQWGLIPPSNGSTDSHTFTLRYHKLNQDTQDYNYFSAQAASNAPLKTSTTTTYTTMTAHPVKDYTFHVHKHTDPNATLNRVEAQPIGEDIVIDQSSLLFRKYCAYTFYAAWDSENNEPVGEPITTYPAEGSDIHVAYTVANLPYATSDLKDMDNAIWYLLIWDASHNHLYVKYDNGFLVNNNVTTRPETINAEDQFAFVGDPYDLKVINRKVYEKNPNAFLGVSSVNASTRATFGYGADFHDSWQITHTSLDVEDTNPDRFTLFVRNGDYNTVGDRWYLSASTSTLATISNNSGNGNPFILEAVNDMVPVTFHVYDRDGKLRIERTYTATYDVGTTLTKMHDEVLRGLCHYTYYPTADDAIKNTNSSGDELNLTLTSTDAVNGVHVYARYVNDSRAFSPWWYRVDGELKSTYNYENIAEEGGTLDDEETHKAALWRFMAADHASGLAGNLIDNYKFRNDRDQVVQADRGRIEADEKDPYLWAAIGDPYSFKALNYYSGAGKYLQLSGTTQLTIPTESNFDTSLSWELMPEKSGVKYGGDEHWFTMRVKDSYEREEVTPKYLSRSNNSAALSVTPVSVHFQAVANFGVKIYSSIEVAAAKAEERTPVPTMQAQMEHTYALGDMVYGLPSALKRQYCTYEYYYNEDLAENHKFNTETGAKIVDQEGVVYAVYTVTDEGKALFSTAENPVWLNLDVNRFWAFDNLTTGTLNTNNSQNGTPDLKKGYQWRLEGDPYLFMIFNRRGGENKYFGVAKEPGLVNGRGTVSFVEWNPNDSELDENHPYRYWGMKLPNDVSEVGSKTRFILKLSTPEPGGVWSDTRYLRHYLGRDNGTKLYTSRATLDCGVQPIACDVIDVTMDVRNEHNNSMLTRVMYNCPVDGSNIDLDPRDKRYTCSYSYFLATDKDGENNIVTDDAAGDMTQVTTYASNMEGHTIFVYYDYDRDLFSNDEGLYRWLNWKFVKTSDESAVRWPYYFNGTSTLRMKGTQAELDEYDESNTGAVNNGGVWALMGDPYRMRLLNFRKVNEDKAGQSADVESAEVSPYFTSSTSGYTMRNKGQAETDSDNDKWPAYWQDTDTDKPYRIVYEWLLNPANGKGYIASHKSHEADVNNNRPLNSSTTLYVAQNQSGTVGITENNGFEQYAEFVHLLKNATKITYHVVHSPQTLRPSSLPELTGVVEYYGVGSTLMMPRAQRRQYLDYYYFITKADAEAFYTNPNFNTTTGLPANAIDPKVPADWDQQTKDVYVAYKLKDDAPFRFSTNTTTLHDPIWYNIISGPGKEQMFQDQKTAGVHAHYTDGNEHPTYDFWWAVEGDPYGFRLMNRYAEDNDMKLAITGFDELEIDNPMNSAGNARMLPSNETGAHNVFEMLIGGFKNHFIMRPVENGAAHPLDVITTNARVPIQLVREPNQGKLDSHVGGNWTFRDLSSQLKKHLQYAGYGFAIDYKALYGPEGNREIVNKIIDGTATAEQIESIEALLRNDANFPDYAGLKEGYYRVTPVSLDPGERFMSGYLKTKQKGTAATAGRLRIDGLTTLDNADRNSLYDPSSIFYIKPIEGEKDAYQLMTQGMYMNDTYSSDEAPAYHITITDLGAGEVQFRTAVGGTEQRGFLSYEYYDRGTVSSNIELNEHSVTHLQDTKWRIQRVISDEAMLADELQYNRNAFRVKMIQGGGDDDELNYYYSSLYVPFDVLLPEGAEAFTAKNASTENGEYRLTCYSTGYSNTGDYKDNSRFVPAGTPVTIRANASCVHNDVTTGVPYITLTLPNNSPSDAIAENAFSGKYLTQELPAGEVPSGKTVYVLGKSSKTQRVGFYKNANKWNSETGETGSGTTNNRAVTHNKIYYAGNVNTSSAAGITLRLVTMNRPPITTDITDITADDVDWENAEVYDLQGRRIYGEPTDHGIYILRIETPNGVVGRKVKK